MLNDLESYNKEKPRVKFCWECGKKLWGNHHVEVKLYGHDRILHKQCAKQVKKDMEHEKEMQS